MTHEELVTRVAIAMRTKREAVSDRPLSKCWEDLARLAVNIAVEEAAKFVDENQEGNGTNGRFTAPRYDGNIAGLGYAEGIRTLKGEPA